jgi:uncharacterized protein YxjI
MFTDRRSFFIREHAGILKLSDAYDILDPQTKQPVGIAREEVSGFVKFLRLLISKSLMPTKVVVRPGENQPPVLTIQRGVHLLRAHVEVLGADGGVIGFFKSKLFSIGGAFTVHDAGGNEVAMVKGDWKGWNFKFTSKAGQEFGVVTKKWSGIGKEMFTSADNYIVALADDAPAEALPLLLAAGLAVDVIFKERR